MFASIDAIPAADEMGKSLGATSMVYGVTTQHRVYLRTFTFRVSDRAMGSFNLEIRLDDGSTLFRDSSLAPIPFRLEGSDPILIEVAAFPPSRHPTGDKR